MQKLDNVPEQVSAVGETKLFDALRIGQARERCDTLAALGSSGEEHV